MSAVASNAPANNPPPASLALTEFEKLRVIYKQSEREQRRTAVASKKSKKSNATAQAGAGLAPELDNLVNAATRGFQCYRKPIMAYYENDRLGKSPTVVR